MSVRVTHAGITTHEMGASLVSDIGGVSADGVMWRVSAADFDPSHADYHVEAGGRRIPVECHENAALGYRYFVARSTEEKTDLLRHLEPLS